MFRGKGTAAKIARILELLEDGQWHMLGDVQKKTRLNEDQIQQIVAFLKEYQFITTDDAKDKIKLQEAVSKFLKRNVTSRVKSGFHKPSEKPCPYL